MNPIPPRNLQPIVDALTVDVEEHFQVSAFEGAVRREDWDRLPSRVEANTARILDVCGEAGVRATFFVLGWIAERHPGLVRRIAADGHEIACHGYSHDLVHTQSEARFREETARSKALLEDVGGVPVIGYRAASFSIRASTLWAAEVLVDLGFAYDSSLYPVVHDRYGIPGAPRHPYLLRTPGGRQIVEVPPSTIRVAGITLPVAGGGYLRLYPLAFTRWAIDRIHRRDGMPAVIYVHPWETDPDQPRMNGPLLSRMRHYVGLRTTVPKLRSLAGCLRLAPMRELVASAAGLREVSPA